jgi:hypothetical protein
MRTMLTLAQAGEVTHRSVRALRQLMSRKKFPYSKISGRVMIDSEELDLFLALSRKISAEQAVQKAGEV